ncbi:SURF1 family protein [Nocardioides caricicola]|uniref:SURF1-like protein n=1 Tax=Nocardioides caricicola TaxID=634770 RepID=A0ABW0MWV3_9ACTN
MSGKLAPRYWGAHLVALVCVGTAIGLGLWQYAAWQAHREAEATDLTGARAVAITDVLGPDDPFPGDQVGQPVLLDGDWVPEGTVFVSGREHDGSAGYWVVTPVSVTGTDAAIPVVRGWAPTVEQAPAPPTGPATVEGWLQPGEGTGEMDDDPGDDVLPQLRLADVIQHVDQDLYGGYVVATEPGDGLEAATLEQLPEVGATTGLKNFLYAVEWWIFGLFAAFMWWRWVREVTEPAPSVEAGDEAPQDHPVPSGS